MEKEIILGTKKFNDLLIMGRSLKKLTLNFESQYERKRTNVMLNEIIEITGEHDAVHTYFKEYSTWYIELVRKVEEKKFQELSNEDKKLKKKIIITMKQQLSLTKRAVNKAEKGKLLY